jgi:AraC-like DNA-binding protein
MPDFAAYTLQDALINLLTDYAPMPCLLTLRSQPEYSYALGPVPRRTHPIYFETQFGRLPERSAHNRRQMRRKELKPFAASHAGLQDLFVPLLPKAGAQPEAWITLGAFQGALPAPAQVWKRWCELRRSVAADDAQAYLLYARGIYTTPVLGPPALAVLGSALAAVGRNLMGWGSTAEALRQLERTKRQALAAGLPYRMWHYTEARRDRYHRGPFQGAELAPWDAQEFGLEGGPDTALALVPRDASPDAVAALHQAAELQWACFNYCRQQAGLVAGRLGDEGALVLMAASRLEARDQALKAAQSLSQRLGWRVACAWSSRPGQREELDETIHAAELGLRTALARGQEMVEAEPLPRDVAADWSSADLGQRLASLAGQGQFEAARLQRADLQVRAVRASNGRPDALRVLLLWGLDPLVQAAQRRLGAGAAETLRAHSSEALGQALTGGELLRAFEAQVEELLARLQSPAQGGLILRLRRAAAQIQQHPEGEQDLRSLARDAGLSPYHFSRQFKRHAGVGFAQARLQARLAKARRLLKESALPIEAVASECGFHNAAHFSTTFKKDQGMSPKQFREQGRSNSIAKKSTSKSKK